VKLPRNVAAAACCAATDADVASPARASYQLDGTRACVDAKIELDAATKRTKPITRFLAETERERERESGRPRKTDVTPAMSSRRPAILSRDQVAGMQRMRHTGNIVV